MLLRRSTVVSLLLSSLAVIATAATGCASSADEGVDSAVGADSIQPFEDPARLLGTVSRKLADNISEADVGKTFGTPDATVPYPDTYWPMTEDGINARWNGSENASPLEKYMGMADATHATQAIAWNRKNSGKDVPGVQDWFGICHGWTGAATSEAPVLHAVYARASGDSVTACSEAEVGQSGCTKFDVGDMNALMATIYADGGSNFIGARCDTSPNDIKRDADGRIDRTANGAGCKGLNPGSLMIVLAHRMKRDQKPMAIDAQSEYNTDQIWNQPAYRYTVNEFKKIDQATATTYVQNGRPSASAGYRWNDAAKGFAYVDVSVHWVSENGPNTSFVSGLASTHKTRMAAVLELDKPASDPTATIIGGELLQGEENATNRLQNHPFVWISRGPGADTGNSGHNPYVKTSVVRQLIALGRQ